MGVLLLSLLLAGCSADPNAWVDQKHRTLGGWRDAETELLDPSNHRIPDGLSPPGIGNDEAGVTPLATNFLDVEGMRPPSIEAIDYFRFGNFRPSPQHFELTSRPGGVSFTLAEGRPAIYSEIEQPDSQVEHFKPSLGPTGNFPYSGKPTAHIDLTYNSTGLNFTVAEVSKPTPQPPDASDENSHSSSSASSSKITSSTVPSPSSTAASGNKPSTEATSKAPTSSLVPAKIVVTTTTSPKTTDKPQFKPHGEEGKEPFSNKTLEEE